jgi:thymidylate synthase
LEKKMQQYKNLLEDILATGEIRDDRTGTGTISVFGRQLRFDLRTSFPAVTGKKLAFNACKSELIWFLEGSTDERRLAEILYGTRDPNKTTIWTGNAEADYWKPKAKVPGDLGRVYGAQWRDFGGVDQVKNLIEGLKRDPNGRRHIISAWNVGELDQMALPPCHVMSQFYVSKNKELSCHMYQRSVDVGLGISFNIASYALLTHMIAQVTDLQVGELIISTGDTHIYMDHVDGLKEQLTREPYPAPTLWLNPDIKNIFDFKMDDIKLVGYQSHPAIKLNMAV